MTPSLTDGVLEACRRHACRVAIRDGTLCWRYADLADQIDFWATRLAQPGIAPRIGFVLPNSAQYLAALYGAIGAGCVPFLMDPSLGPAEIDKIALDVGLSMLLAPTGADLPYPDIADIEGLRLLSTGHGAGPWDLDEETAVCRFTSGTNGTPKCLEFSHRAICEAARVWAVSNQLGPRDDTLCLSGFFNGLAFNTSLTATILSGASLSIHSGWASPRQVMRHAARQATTRLVGFPVFYRLLAESGLSPDAIPASLERCYSAASTLDEMTRKAVMDRYGLAIADYYGVAEAGPVTTEPDPREAHSNGVPLAGCDIRAHGELLEVRTPYFATRYLNAPGLLESLLTPDGYLRTPDRARIEGDRLFLEGRLGTMLDVGGKKVASAEIEAALLALPGIAEVYVFGYPVPDRGMEICAAVAGRGSGTPKAIRDGLGTRLARFKVPRTIRVMDALPRNAAGKIDAPGIRRELSKGAR